jgi:4-hydroxybenzoyl-CoA reductase subunit beta
MMRASRFRYYAATDAADAARALAGEADAMLLAGGTDLVPNMKRRTQTPGTVVGLRRCADMLGVANGDGLRVGAMTTLADVAADPRVRAHARALAMAAGSVATVHLRAMGSLGGNLCLDTRCNYYDQNAEWREAIGFCMKAPRSTGGHACASPDGSSICWVATSSPRCWAVSSTDCAPALIALGAEVTLRGPEGTRTIPIGQLYANDGMAYLTKRRDEVLTSVCLKGEERGARGEVRSTYWKLRRRGSFDFPVLGVAATVRLGTGNVVEEARIVLGAVASHPVLLEESAVLIGKPLTDEAIHAVSEAATAHARPMDNTDFELSWRKKVVKSYVRGALEELRGAPPPTS